MSSNKNSNLSVRHINADVFETVMGIACIVEQLDSVEDNIKHLEKIYPYNHDSRSENFCSNTGKFSDALNEYKKYLLRKSSYLFLNFIEISKG